MFREQPAVDGVTFLSLKYFLTPLPRLRRPLPGAGGESLWLLELWAVLVGEVSKVDAGFGVGCFPSPQVTCWNSASGSGMSFDE